MNSRLVSACLEHQRRAVPVNIGQAAAAREADPVRANAQRERAQGNSRGSASKSLFFCEKKSLGKKCAYRRKSLFFCEKKALGKNAPTGAKAFLLPQTCKPSVCGASESTCVPMKALAKRILLPPP